MFKIYERPGCCKCASIIHQTTITLLQETWVRKNFADTSHRSPVSSIEKIQNPTLYKFALANNKKIKKIGPIQYGKLIYRLEKINTSIVEGKKKKKQGVPPVRTKETIYKTKRQQNLVWHHREQILPCTSTVVLNQLSNN